MMNYAIETLHLKKVYKDKIVVNDVNIHVKKGDIYGFVGPNGAGKSTLMKMLLNLVQANSGEIVIFGNKVIESDFEILKRIGSIIENPYFYEKLTARENLDLHCEYMGYHNKKRETLFCELSDMKIFEQGTEDNYSCNYIPFKVLNYTIQVSNEKLANALYKLSDKEREVILLRYFQSMRDKEIADLYQVSRSAIYRRRSNGLKKLKTLLKERN